MDSLLQVIEDQSRGPLGHPNPVATVTCPCCAGRMAAIDAKRHVEAMRWRASFGLPLTLDGVNAAALAESRR